MCNHIILTYQLTQKFSGNSMKAVKMKKIEIRSQTKNQYIFGRSFFSVNFRKKHPAIWRRIVGFQHF